MRHPIEGAAAVEGLAPIGLAAWGFDGRTHTGQLIVNKDAAAPLVRVFRQLYALRFPIRHMRLADTYGPSSS